MGYDAVTARGECVAELCRSHDSEALRVVDDFYADRRFVTLRLWKHSSSDGWWPTKAGVTIRAVELDVVIHTLRALADRFGVSLSKSLTEGRDQSASGWKTLYGGCGNGLLPKWLSPFTGLVTPNVSNEASPSLVKCLQCDRCEQPGGERRFGR